MPAQNSFGFSSTDELVDLIRSRSRRIGPLPASGPERGRLARGPRCVLFDVYGTLLVRVADGRPRPEQRRRRINTLVRNWGLPVSAEQLDGLLSAATVQELSALRVKGSSHPEVIIEHIWAGLFPGLAPGDLRRVIVEYELAAHPAWPMPGCRSLLRSLARRGIRLGILSNAQFYTPLFLRALLGDDLPDLGFSPELCVYSYALGAAKPDRALFTLAVERLRAMGIPAGETVMVGNDPASDIAPAAEAGFMTVRAALDSRSAAPASAGMPEPDAVIRRLASLRDLVREAS